MSFGSNRCQQCGQVIRASNALGGRPSIGNLPRPPGSILDARGSASDPFEAFQAFRADRDRDQPTPVAE